MKLGIVVPTIPGREASLERCLTSYREKTEGIEVTFSVLENSPSAGAGWKMGAETLEQAHGPVDYLHLTNDDIECANDEWWTAAAEVTDTNQLPAPIVRNSDGSLQSAGGQLGANGDLLREIAPDGTRVGFTTVPFMSWSQWKQIGMLEVHYSSDVYVSERGRQLGIETVLCHDYELIHHMEQVGRLNTAGADKNRVLDALR
jgi:3-deoxy-D-manno-octulosonic acid (KDO) 8-phosphate synthase